MNKTVIRKIIDEYEGNDLAGYIVSELEEIKHIEREKMDIQQAILKEKNEGAERVKKLNNRMSELQRKCKHWSSTIYGDPSGYGGSDSFYKCDQCGSVWT